MRRALTAALCAACSFASLAACSSAGGTARGGEDTFDASPAPIPDAGTPPATDDAGSGITWTDLYRDFFGKPAPGPGCSGSIGCHGVAGSGGGGVWVCGDTKDTCWAGLTSTTAALIDTTNPDNSTLLSIALRNRQGGNMPQQPATYVFSDASMKRIRDWMAAGAQNN